MHNESIYDALPNTNHYIYHSPLLERDRDIIRYILHTQGGKGKTTHFRTLFFGTRVDVGLRGRNFSRRTKNIYDTLFYFILY